MLTRPNQKERNSFLMAQKIIPPNLKIQNFIVADNPTLLKKFVDVLERSPLPLKFGQMRRTKNNGVYREIIIKESSKCI